MYGEGRLLLSSCDRTSRLPEVQAWGTVSREPTIYPWILSPMANHKDAGTFHRIVARRSGYTGVSTSRTMGPIQLRTSE